jgi:menaquinol-cytochrome c reductase iron-sulfur subunit
MYWKYLQRDLLYYLKGNNMNPITNNSRRGFLKRLGQGGIFLAFGAHLYVYIRSLFPNVLYEPPKRIKIGDPQQFPEGIKFLKGQRLYVFNNGSRFHAISAVCTHLGCTVKVNPFEKPRNVLIKGKEMVETFEFLCPCHGSKFHSDGTNYSGPAPKPLPWYKLEIAPDDAQLVVDLEVKVNSDFKLVVS